jgi:hypothetical protein
MLAPLGTIGRRLGEVALLRPEGVMLTPMRTETDGFFVSILQAVEAGS